MHQEGQWQQLQYSQQWGPDGPRIVVPNSSLTSWGNRRGGCDIGPCKYQVLTSPDGGTTCWHRDPPLPAATVTSTTYTVGILDLTSLSRTGLLCLAMVTISISCPSAATASPVLALVAGSGPTSVTAPLSFTLDSGASSCFFSDYSNLAPLLPPVTVTFVDLTMGPVTVHLDVWSPSPVLGPRRVHFFLIVVDDYSRYTTDLALRRKADVPTVLEPWLQSSPLQRPVRIMSEGVGGAAAEGEGTRATGAGGAGSGGAGVLRVGTFP
ncbi:unnamed protein product [Closterium sp. NIES-54]